MSENKHQFHVGDWVNLKASMSLTGINLRLRSLLVEAYTNGSHRVCDVRPDGRVHIEVKGLEQFAFRPGWLCLATVATPTPIDDLI